LLKTDIEMKGVFWNSNGLRDPAKCRFLFEATREKRLDFVAVLETKRNDFNTQEFSHLCAGKNFSWSWSAPRGRSGGIFVGLNLDCFKID
jgi:exonuclease III